MSCLLLISGFSLLACEPALVPPTTVRGVVDEVVMPHIALGSNVGIIVGVSRRGEQATYAYGEAELGTRLPIGPESVFELASATKIFTALLLADMHLRGEVRLDDSVNRYLPPGVRLPGWHGRPVTLRQLANHTAGLPALATNMDQEAYNYYQGYTQEKLYEYLNTCKLEYEPGTQTLYSNVGYGLLGHVLSRRANASYENLVTTRIGGPLGMRRLGAGSNAALQQQRVQGHHGNRKVESWAGQMEPCMQGSGGLLSSMEDMLRFLEAHMGTRPTALQPALDLTQQLTYQVAADKGLGLGWTLQTIDKQHLVYKNGLNSGFETFVGFNRETQTGVVLLSNSSQKPDLFQTQMGLALLKRLHEL